jgi:hypothetical protein
MKQQITVFDSDKLYFFIITKNINKDLIKDFDIYFKEKTNSHILSVLKGFKEKTIDYTYFIENIVKDAPSYPKDPLRYSRIRYLPKTQNSTRNSKAILEFLLKEHGSDWRKLNWNEFRRKEKKESKKNVKVD